LISTTVRTKRPQWAPLLWRRGASRGTVTVVVLISVIFIGALYFIRQTHLNREEILLKRCCKHGDKYTSILIRKFPDHFEGSHKPASEHLPDARSPAATPRAVWIDKGASNEKEI
jgi:hypothetical protein